MEFYNTIPGKVCEVHWRLLGAVRGSSVQYRAILVLLGGGGLASAQWRLPSAEEG